MLVSKRELEGAVLIQVSPVKADIFFEGLQYKLLLVKGGLGFSRHCCGLRGSTGMEFDEAVKLSWMLEAWMAVEGLFILPVDAAKILAQQCRQAKGGECSCMR